MVPARVDPHSEEEVAPSSPPQEQKEKEVEKLRDEQFDKYRPRIPQGKVWQVKANDQPTGPVGPL